jgi:malyl-CoA/(S)-citramalyl-CoA lyase
MQPKARTSTTIQRSLLAVPALSTGFFEKAAKGDADSVFLDLEDSVPPESKIAARREAIKALNAVDWRKKTIGLRVNALDTEWGFRDIVDSVSQCGRLDFVILPRVERPFDVQYVDALLGSLEREIGRDIPISIQAMIETPLGVAQVEAIAAVPSRLDALSFGLGDFSINMSTPANLIDAAGEDWTFAVARIAIACKAHGLRPIDGPYTRFADLEGLRARAALVGRYGYEGKWVIHPSQITPCQDAFSPSAAHVAWAKATLATLEQTLASGIGAMAHNGQLLDMAHVRLARDIIARATGHSPD